MEQKEFNEKQNYVSGHSFGQPPAEFQKNMAERAKEIAAAHANPADSTSLEIDDL
ncbi:hypothetical protein HN954_03120 [bacterium]|jgi:pyruvate/oxaloacetate carboxyltransferase|nr:hypothetical protein [bacterium]MBT6832158.1 hypothetical protein [bacterium]MBT6996396.1 hypothetical protein [bacterium]MBT7772131.1 hypothetical protein [bacterium]